MTRAQVAEQLAQPPTGNPPTFLQVAREIGFVPAAEQVNRWCEAGCEGDWHDEKYRPRPRKRTT